MEENEEYSLEPRELFENLYGLLNILGRRTARILIDFASEVQKRVEESGLPDDRKKEMLTQIQMAVTAEKLRMQHIEYELANISGK